MDEIERAVCNGLSRVGMRSLLDDQGCVALSRHVACVDRRASDHTRRHRDNVDARPVKPSVRQEGESYLPKSSTACDSRVGRAERQNGGEHQRARDGNVRPVGLLSAN